MREMSFGPADMSERLATAHNEMREEIYGDVELVCAPRRTPVGKRSEFDRDFCGSDTGGLSLYIPVAGGGEDTMIALIDHFRELEEERAVRRIKAEGRPKRVRHNGPKKEKAVVLSGVMTCLEGALTIAAVVLENDQRAATAICVSYVRVLGANGDSSACADEKLIPRIEYTPKRTVTTRFTLVVFTTYCETCAKGDRSQRRECKDPTCHSKHFRYTRKGVDWHPRNKRLTVEYELLTGYLCEWCRKYDVNRDGCCSNDGCRQVWKCTYTWTAPKKGGRPTGEERREAKALQPEIRQRRVMYNERDGRKRKVWKMDGCKRHNHFRHETIRYFAAS